MIRSRRALAVVTLVTLLGGVMLTASPGRAEERSIDEWIAALKHEDGEVRLEAAGALKDLKQAYAVPALIDALEDERAEVRAAAASALGVLNDPYAIEPLIGRLKDEHEAVRKESADALARLTGQSLGEEHQPWAAWWDRNKPSSCGY